MTTITPIGRAQVRPFFFVKSPIGLSTEINCPTSGPSPPKSVGMLTNLPPPLGNVEQLSPLSGYLHNSLLPMLLNPLLAILGLLAILLYPYVLTVWKVRQTPHECIRHEDANPEDLPAEISEAIYPQICELEAIDFELVKYTLVYLNGSSAPPAWMIFLQDPTSSHYAYLGILQSSTQTQPTITVEFITYGDRETVLFTTSTKDYSVFKPYPGTVKQHLIGYSVAELWQAHKAKLKALAARPLSLTIDDFLAKSKAHSDDSTALSIKNGRFRWIEVDKTYRYSLATAIRRTWQAAVLRFFKQEIGTKLETTLVPAEFEWFRRPTA
jgi:hypothetical protein